MPLQPGDKAPAIALSDQSGKTVKLSDFKGRKVLVFFYPKADTPGCTKQACGLNDVLGDIGDTAVLGISPDKPSKQLKFAEKYGLGFPLLADEDHKVASKWGVWDKKKLYGREFMGIVRSAFVVDERIARTRSARSGSARSTSAKLAISQVWPRAGGRVPARR